MASFTHDVVAFRKHKDFQFEWFIGANFVYIAKHVLLYFLCSVDKPTKMEKVRMAQSIVARFPVLKADGNAGYVSSTSMYI